MARHLAQSRSLLLARVASVALLAGLTAACNSATLTTGATGARPAAYTGQPMPPALIGNTPIQNGQATTAMAAPTPTGPMQAAVTTSNLAPVGGAPAPAPGYTPSPTYAAAAAYPAAPTQAPTQVAAAGPAAAQNIVAQPGDTLYSLSRRYGVSVAAIAAANGLTQTSMLTIGQQLLIPAAGSTGALGTPPAPLGTMTTNAGTPGATPIAAPAPVAAPAAQQVVANAAPTQIPGQHIVQPGETIYSIAMSYGISPMALAQANNIDAAGLVRAGQALAIPSATRTPVATTTPAPAPLTTAAPTVVATVASPPQPAPTRTPVPAPTATPAPQPAATLPPATQPAAVAAQSTNGTTFSWPLQGRLVSDFGPKPGGERNDGIDLAAAAGTEIKASEAGTVIYAGNEIPGYGNLVLIRHADNWVTAYAHASQILVQKDQQVTRGQTIALVGQTGSVTSPQLHFELRRGSTPVNPLTYLPN